MSVDGSARGTDRRAPGAGVSPVLGEQRLWRLLQTGRSLVADLDLDSILHALLEAARDLTGARYAALGVLAPDRRQLERFVTLGVDAAAQEAIGSHPRGRGVLGLLVNEPRTLRLGDVGAHPESYGFPHGHPPMGSFLGVPVLVRGVAWGNLYLTEKDGGFDEADEHAIVVLSEWAGTAIENARLYAMESSRRRELERAVGALEATTEITRAIGAETRLERVLELVAKRARSLVEANSVLILLRDGDELVVAAAAGRQADSLTGTRVPIRDSASGAVLRGREPARLADVHTHLRFALADHLEAESGLLVPLVYGGRSVGVLEAFDRLADGPEFSAEDERLLQAFATSAATAVVTAQDVAQQGLRRSIEASDRERARWARELHDETLQTLAALKLSLGALQRTDKTVPSRPLLTEMAAAVDQAIGELRNIIGDLRPAALDAIGAGPAIESLAARMRDRGRLAVELEIRLPFHDGLPARHPPAVEDTMYRIVQEALTNVLKHSAASRVVVRITQNDGAIEIEVEDDGDGFDPEARADGFGLIGMRERLQLVQGALSVDSQPGNGTRIRAAIPLPEPRAGSRVEPRAEKPGSTA